MTKQELLEVINKHVGCAEREIYDALDEFITGIKNPDYNTPLKEDKSGYHISPNQLDIHGNLYKDRK